MHRAELPSPAHAPAPLPHTRLEEIDPPVPMLLLERGFRIRWLSSAAAAEFGVKPADVVGRCWYDLFPASAARRHEHEAMFAGELPALDVPDVEIACPHGPPRWFAFRLRPVHDAAGAVVAVLGVGADATPRVLAERELRTSEAKFRAMTQESRDLVVICDATGTLTYANAAVERAVGRGQRHCASAFDHIHPDDLPRAREMFARLVADPSVGVLHHLHVRKQHADGTWRWLEFTASNLLAHPAVRGIVLNGRDVTARQEALADAEASRAQFETALWGSKAAYWRVLLDEDRAEMSTNFWSLFGIDREEWERDPHPWNARLHPDDRARVLRAWADCVAGRIEFYEIDYRLRTARGWVWLQDRARITERHPDGRPRVIAGIAQDATARKTLETALAEAVAAEQRRLGYDLHDGLGQELTGVQFLLASVANRLRAARPEEAAALDEAQAFVRGAIDTTRMMAQGLGTPGLRHGDLRFAIEALAADVSRRHGLRVECRTEGWTRDAVSEATAQQLYRIVQEAVTNARRHGGGARVTIELAARANGVVLVVDDDGCGIPEPVPAGRGMGLAIMAERARSVGAEFTVGRTPAGGTRVLVQVPAQDGVERDAAAT